METPSDTSDYWRLTMQATADALRTAGITSIETYAWRDLADRDAGGSEVHADHVLSRWAHTGLSITHRTSCEGDPETFERNGYTVIRRGGRYSVFAQVLMRKLLKRPGRNIAVVEIWNGVPWFSQLWANKIRSVWLHHIHEDMWSESLPAPLAPIARWVEVSFAPRLYRQTNIGTLADTTRDELVSRGFSPERVRVAEPGIDPRFVPQRLRKTPTPSLIAVGRLAPVKRFSSLLSVFTEVVRNIPDAHLTIAGDGPERATLDQLVNSLGLAQNVTMAGRVTDEELLHLYQSRWLLVSASHSEGWGMTITEAAACGTPCVVTKNHGHDAAAVHEITGFIVENDQEMTSSIIDVLQDHNLRQRLSVGAQHHASQFTWDRTASILLQMLADPVPM